ncbi:glycosyltransferase family 4 protein [Lutibacter sp. B2]|nr:glycosyltransferase family 4 protein [Lutibacter sp. B2]
MKICFDGIGISHLKESDLYNYTYGLIANLINIYPQAKYEVVMNKGREVDLWAKNENIKLEYMDLNRNKNDYSILLDHIKSNNINIYHSVNNGFSIPKEKGCKYIMSVHDLLSVSKNEYVDPKYSNKFMTVFPNALEKSDEIIAVSDFIKNEIIQRYKVSKDKIKVIYPVCSKQFKPIDIEKSKYKIKHKYKIEGDYLLFAGDIHIRKNLPLIFRAFKEVLKAYQDLKLVIIGNCEGKREVYYLKLKEYARTLNIDNNILFVGSVPYEDRPYFYNGAKCIIDLSEYEGFPLSVVEAMACNIPIICSQSSSFKEVLGSAAAFVESKELNEIKDIISEVLYNKAFRLNLIEKGKKQILKYQSDEPIKQMVRLYESMV